MEAPDERAVDEVAAPPPDPAAPGWHRDPFGRRRFRWWDGERWTGYAGSDTAVEWDEEADASEIDAGPGMPGIPTAVVGFVAGVGLLLLVRRLVDDRGDVAEALGSSAALWVGLLGAVVVVCRRRGSGSLVRDIGLSFRWSDVGVGFGASFGARLLTGVAASPLPVPWERLRDVEPSVGPHGTGQWFALVFVTCVGAPFVEEIFFRGLLQPRLVGRLGPVVGIGVTAGLFGAAHLLGWRGPETFGVAWAIAIGGGVGLGALRHYSGRLGPSIMAHLFFNLQVMILLALR